MKKVILYTPGSHGSFLKFLFDCYDQNKVMEFDTGKTGNWHATRNVISDNVCFDMANDMQIQEYNKITYEREEFRVVFDTHDDFCYTLQCLIDRGGALRIHSGIELLEKSLDEYQKEYVVATTYRQVIKDLYGYHDATAPRFVLRNLFILIFIEHFKHRCWQVNDVFKKHGKNLINLKEILDYDRLKHQLDSIFNRSLDFADAHKHLLENNKPYKQLLKVRDIIHAVETGKDMNIQGLNTISEAYLCFYFEQKYFSINFNLSNDFFKTAKDLRMYIDHYPSYMKRPNNLFVEHWRNYKSDK